VCCFLCSRSSELSDHLRPNQRLLRLSRMRYTQYELLAPETASFKITYEVTATTPGATAFFNPIRKGSVASDEAVFDMMSDAPLKFEQVSGAQAKETGLADADPESDYIRVATRASGSG